MMSLGTRPDVPHSLQVFCSCPWQLLIPVSPSPTSLQEPVKWSATCQQTEPEKLGVNLDPHACRLLAEMKFCTLCFGLDRGLWSMPPFPERRRTIYLGQKLFQVQQGHPVSIQAGTMLCLSGNILHGGSLAVGLENF